MARQIVKSSNVLYRDGFTAVSNTLLDNYEELGMNEDQLMFIIFIYRHIEGFKATDKAICGRLSSRTLNRRRKSLKDLGLLNYDVYKKSDEEGNVQSYIVYDLKPLEDRLIELSYSKSTFAEKQEEVVKEKAEKVVEETEDSVKAYCEEYKDRFGTKYTLTKDEKELIKNLTSVQKESLRYIFEWYDLHMQLSDLPENCNPRLSFFLKIPFRMKSLVDFYLENNTDRVEEAVEDSDGIQEEVELLYGLGIDPIEYYKNNRPNHFEAQITCAWNGKRHSLTELKKAWIPYKQSDKEKLTNREVYEALDLDVSGLDINLDEEWTV